MMMSSELCFLERESRGDSLRSLKWRVRRWFSDGHCRKNVSQDVLKPQLQLFISKQIFRTICHLVAVGVDAVASRFCHLLLITSTVEIAKHTNINQKNVVHYTAIYLWKP